MPRIIIAIIFIVITAGALLISGCTGGPAGSNYSSGHTVLYLYHTVGHHGSLLSVTYTAPPGYNVTLNFGHLQLFYSINGGEQKVLVPGLQADSFMSVYVNGTKLEVSEKYLIGNKNLTTINFYEGEEEGINRNIFGNVWVHTVKGTYRIPENIGYSQYLPITLEEIESNGTAILSCDNATYALPVGATMNFYRHVTENSTIEKENVNFTLAKEYNVSETIMNYGWFKDSDIVYGSAWF